MTGRDHGGRLDAAVARHGGRRGEWLDLSTGINPVPYPLPGLPRQAWTTLPDSGAVQRLLDAARGFWQVPAGAVILAAPGASAIIARIPALIGDDDIAFIPEPTYNEHAAAFEAHGWSVVTEPTVPFAAQVHVHPNNPDGRPAAPAESSRCRLTVIDESFCDVAPGDSLIARTAEPGTLVIKSFGKFWGLAGLRLGFAIGHPDTLRQSRQFEFRAGWPWARRTERHTWTGPHLCDLIGPWAVSGPALDIGAEALEDRVWAESTRMRLKKDAARLDALLTGSDAAVAGGTTLFRLYEVDDAAAWQERLAKARIWSRVFPYSRSWLRLGLPPPDRWSQLESAL